MRLLHTSDWHLGATAGERLLKEDQESFINEICSIIQQEKIDAVMIAGDIYDRSVPAAEAIKLYDYAMTRICKELKVPVLSIAGNHDSADRLSTCNQLLGEAGLHISGSLSTKPDVVSIGNADIYLVPWFTINKVKSLYPDSAEAISTYTDAYQLVFDNIRASFAEGKKHIVLSHAFITDSETSTSDNAAEIGFATQVSASVFEGFDYVALGHIHKPQDVNEFIRYSGTPMIYSFGKEEKQVKSVTIIDTDTMEHKIVPLNMLHKWTTLEGTYEEIRHPEVGDEVKNGYVRIKVTDILLGPDSTQTLKNIYPNAIELSGRSFEANDSGTHITMEEFRELETNPVEIFRRFCKDIGSLDTTYDDHRVQLFAEAITAVEEEN